MALHVHDPPAQAGVWSMICNWSAIASETGLQEQHPLLFLQQKAHKDSKYTYSYTEKNLKKEEGCRDDIANLTTA